MSLPRLAQIISINTEAFRQDVIKAREELNISQKQLARDANCSPYAINSLEVGVTRRVNMRTLIKLCDALGLDSAQYIVGSVPSMEEEAEAAQPEEETPVTSVEGEPIKPIQSIKRDPSSLEVRLLRLRDEKDELKQQVQLKSRYLQEKTIEIEELKAKLKEDEQLIESLLIYAGRLKAGEIVG